MDDPLGTGDDFVGSAVFGVFLKEGRVLKGRDQFWRKKSANWHHDELVGAKVKELTLVGLLKLGLRRKVRHGTSG